MIFIALQVSKYYLTVRQKFPIYMPASIIFIVAICVYWFKEGINFSIAYSIQTKINYIKNVVLFLKPNKNFT